MIYQNLLILLAAKLAAGAAIDTSPQVIDLDATELQRRAACAAAGVVNGQCGRYYRGTGCNDQIGAIDPGVRCHRNLNSLTSCANVNNRDVAGRVTGHPITSRVLEPLVMVPMARTAICTMMTIVRTRSARLGMPSLEEGNAIRQGRADPATVSCAGTGAKYSPDKVA